MTDTKKNKREREGKAFIDWIVRKSVQQCHCDHHQENRYWLYRQLIVVDRRKPDDWDEREVEEFVNHFQSLKKNNQMWMNDIHRHLNFQMIRMLAVQYD